METSQESTSMAADCMTRLCALAIATAACVILPGALVYEIVRTAAARRFGAAIALSVFLVIWAAASAVYYPRVCADIVRQSPLVRSLQGQRTPARRQPGGGGGVLLARFVAQSRQEDRGNTATGRREAQNVRGGSWVVGEGTLLLAPYGGWQRNGALLLAPLLFVARRGQIDHGGMEALPREPPSTRHGARVVAGGTLASPHERRRDDGEPPFERCAVCLYDVEKVETAAWLPACLHMFHRHCIDQWLHQYGRSTCPICRCRCDAFAAPLPREHMV